MQFIHSFYLVDVYCQSVFVTMIAYTSGNQTPNPGIVKLDNTTVHVRDHVKEQQANCFPPKLHLCGHSYTTTISIQTFTKKHLFKQLPSGAQNNRIKQFNLG